MNILHVITRSEWGGAQKVVYQLALAQRKLGRTVTVMCGEDGRLVRELEQSGIKVVKNRFLQRGLGLDDVRAGLALRHELMRGYDLVHAHSSKAGALARLLAPRYQVPVCFTVHGFGVSPDHPRWKRILYHAIESYLARRTSALVFVNPADYDAGKAQGWLKHGSGGVNRRPCLVKVIPNGVMMRDAPEKTAVQREKMRQSLGIPPQAYVIGNLARVAWIKNPEFWLETAKDYLGKHAQGTDTFFVWFGGGEPTRIKELNAACPGRILFQGETEDIESALAGIDVLFLSSRSEGMPLAVLESLSLGVPVVAPALPGLVKMFKSTGGEEASVLFYQTGEHRQAQAALESLRSPDVRRRLGEQGAAMCRREYSLEKMVLAYEEVYALISGQDTKSERKE